MHITDISYARTLVYPDSHPEAHRPFRCQYVYNEITMLQAQSFYGAFPVTSPQRIEVVVSSIEDNYYLAVL